MNTREHMLAAVRGDSTPHLLFAPRLDLWYPARLARGDMPSQYKDLSMQEISAKEGWTPYRIMPDFLDLKSPEDLTHRGLGLVSNRMYVCGYEFGGNVEFEIEPQDEGLRIRYHSPFGSIQVEHGLPEQQRKNGGTYPLITSNAIDNLDDYRVVSYIFEHLRPIPDYGPFEEFEQQVGPDTLCFAAGCMAASPMHLILRDFIDPTQFYLHYQDHPEKIRELADSMEGYFRRLIEVVARSPAQGVVWGANFDDMLTYPAFFKKEILPWLQYACDRFHNAGKLVASHTDGENKGLMDLIKDSGIDLADSVCPFPMSKVGIGEYYRRWGDRIAILGGIPQDFLLADSTTVDELNGYMEQFFSDIAPGRRFIVGIADAVPPDADFDRLKIIGEKVDKMGRLPLTAGSFNPVSPTPTDGHPIQLEGMIAELQMVLKPHAAQIGALCEDLSGWLKKAGQRLQEEDRQKEWVSSSDALFTSEEVVPPEPSGLGQISQDVLDGDDQAITGHIQALLDDGFSPQSILRDGMLKAMEKIGERFKDGTVFIPEVLLSARAMNSGVAVLEPYLAEGDEGAEGSFMIGTVFGDMHDIGKNIVLTMIRGTGFSTIDLGINVKAETFVEEVRAQQPDILGLSALLTTTMPEMRNVIEALEAAGLRNTVKIIVGGAPVNESFARKIGADGYAKDAGAAITLAKEFLKKETA